MAALDRTGGTHRTSATSGELSSNCFTIAASARVLYDTFLATRQAATFILFLRMYLYFISRLTSRCASVVYTREGRNTCDVKRRNLPTTTQHLFTPLATVITDSVLTDI